MKAFGTFPRASAVLGGIPSHGSIVPKAFSSPGVLANANWDALNAKNKKARAQVWEMGRQTGIAQARKLVDTDLSDALKWETDF